MNFFHPTHTTTSPAFATGCIGLTAGLTVGVACGAIGMVAPHVGTTGFDIAGAIFPYAWIIACSRGTHEKRNSLNLALCSIVVAIVW